MPQSNPFPEFARNVRAARKAAGLVQADLALMIGVRESCVSNWETGRSWPHRAHLATLVLALGKPLSWLVAEHDEDEVAA